MTDNDPNNPNEQALHRRMKAAMAPHPGPCPTALDLAATIDGRLEEADRDRIEAHLASCEACLSAVREARDLLAGSPVVAPAALVARAAALVPKAAAHPWRGVARWTAAAAAGIVIAVVGFRAGQTTLADTRAADTRAIEQVSFGLIDDEDALGFDELALMLDDDSSPDGGVR